MKNLILVQIVIFAIFLVGLGLNLEASKQTYVEFDAPRNIGGSAAMHRPIYNSAKADLRVQENAVPEVIVEEPRVIKETIDNDKVTGMALLDPSSQVMFWFSTPHGAVKDLLRSGESKIYTFGGKEYQVDVVFIGEGDDRKGEALFLVNGKSTKSLSRKESKVFNKGEFLYVREVYYKG